MKRKELERKLKQAGFVLREGGNHTLVFDKTGERLLTQIPRHDRDIALGTFKKILKLTGQAL